MNYAEKLKDPRWQKKRLEILERDGWKCSACSDSTRTLHVHHGYYARNRNPWEYNDSTMHCLCEKCHIEAQADLEAVHFAVAKIPVVHLFSIFKVLIDLEFGGKK